SWQAVLQVEREAIGRNDVEAGSGEQHDASIGRSRSERRHTFEHVDFARDVEVVRSCAQTAFNHWPIGVSKGAGAVEHDCHVLQSAVEATSVVETDRPVSQAKLLGDLAEPLLVTPGNDRI